MLKTLFPIQLVSKYPRSITNDLHARVFPEELQVAQVVKRILYHYVTQKTITLLTKACWWNIILLTKTQFTPPSHSIS